jgi:murein DD-endopeptidase MepM/ murein hydrolase activator NlpD
MLSPSPVTRDPERRLPKVLGGPYWGLGALALGVGYLLHVAVPMYDAHRVQAENLRLGSELEVMQERLASLQEVVESLASEDGTVRTLAGLPALDRDVLRVGVGGPGGLSPDTYVLTAMGDQQGGRAFSVAYDLEVLERRATLLRESFEEAANAMSMQTELMATIPSILPVEGVISSHFSHARLHPIHNRILPHEGLDIAAPTGAPIMASGQGRVVFAGPMAGYGLMVEIDHGFGMSTVYAHASRLLVRVGQEVQRGEVIAQVGATGVATAPHLHYEVRQNGRALDPMNYILIRPGSAR